MALRWQMRFMSRSNILYYLNIYDPNYSGSRYGLLTPANKPFVTQEDDNDDIFTPIRTQSGYIRIMDDGNVDWDDLLPTTATDRPVTLSHTSGNTTVIDWQGFIQPRTFSGRLFEPTQERSIPVCCPLTVLGSFDMPVNPATTCDFGKLLYYIFANIPTLTLGNFYFAGVAGSTNNREWLTKLVSWANFRELDDDGNATSKYTAKDLLEEVCKFWGWTCRTKGQDVYFVNPAWKSLPAYMICTLQDLDTGIASATIDTEDYQTTYALTGDIYASVNNSDEIMQGIRKAVVKADINKYDETLSFDADGLVKWMDKIGADTVRTAYGDNSYFTRDTGFLGYEGEPGNRYIKIKLENATLTIPIDDSNQPWISWAEFFQYYWYEGDLNDLHDIPFTTALKAKWGGSQMAGDKCFILESNTPITISDGVLVIQADTFANTISGGQFKQYNGYCGIYCLISIGNMYWNGSAWSSTRQNFILYVGGKEFAEGSGTIPSNRVLNQTTWSSPYPNYNGYGMPLPDTTLSGILRVEMQAIGTHYIDNVCFSSIDVKFFKKSERAALSKDDENIYTGSQTGQFVDEKEVSTTFASYNNNEAGHGIIMNPNGGYCDFVSYQEQEGGGSQAHPEQWLADKMSVHGSTTKHKVKVEVFKSLVADITPLHDVTMAAVSGTLHPAAISNEWRDDIEKITLLEE